MEEVEEATIEVEEHSMVVEAMEETEEEMVTPPRSQINLRN